MSDKYTGPRNRLAVARSRAVRAAIFQTWGELVLEFAYGWPASRPPTAKDIARRLPARYRLSERGITWHMSRLTLEAQIGELVADDKGCGSGNSSAAEAPLE